MTTATSETTTVRGRDAELATLGAQLDRVRSGVGAVVLVEGAPGLAKTRLLAEGARMRAGWPSVSAAAPPTRSRACSSSRP